jgi:DNA-directed RNA polymerase subunit RPC12/RpoP
MPPINRYECDRCDFRLPGGWGGYMYVTDEAGARIVCPHPAEHVTVTKVLGEGAPGKLIRERTGFSSHCVCLDCLHQFDLDLERDERGCPQCGSAVVKSLREMIGKPCPKCKRGTVREIRTGIIS